MTLDEHLAKLYAARVLSKRDGGNDAMAAFRTALADDTLRAQARKRLTALEPISDMRCFVSKMHKDFLREALAP